MSSISSNLPISSGMSVAAVFTAVALAVGLVVFRVFLQSTPIPTTIPTFSVLSENDSKSKTHASTTFPTLSAALGDIYPKLRNVAYVVKGQKSLIWKPTVIVPPAWVDELKSLPENQLSFGEANDERFNLDLTGAKMADPESYHAFIKTVSVDLTRHIAKIMADMDDELINAFDRLVPACDDWTEIYMGQLMPQIVALVSGRIFVGGPLHRDPEFLNATIMYTVDIFKGGERLNDFPRSIRPWVAPFIGKVKECKKWHNTMQRLLKPQLEQRIAMAERGEKLPVDMMTWIINNSPEGKKFDIHHQAQCQLGISLAAIHTTTMTATHALFDLGARVEYIQPMRDEWDEVMAIEPTKAISKTAMPKLKKLDSFIKESQRVNPLGPDTFGRKVLTELTLPDGTKLPKGSYIAVAAQAIANDKNIWRNPEVFDGFRFEKLRQQPGNESRYQFATTGPETMFFGHGNHACPGRFFAANEIKLIVAYIYRNYDLKFPDGQGRPGNIYTPAGTMPDYSKPILFRRRKD